MRGSIKRRCNECRRIGQSGLQRCDHKDAAYYVVYRIGGRQQWKRVGPNKKEAERVLSEVVSQINNGTYQVIKPITFKDFADKWLEDYARGAVKDSTLRAYRNMIHKRIIPAIGNLPLSQITTYRLQSFSAALLKGRNPNTVLKFVVLLKTMFKHARRWNFVRENPALDVERPRVEHKEMDFLNPSEIRALLANAEEPFKTLFLTAILTGMRRGELLGLQWGDVDWHAGLIYIRRSLFALNRSEAEASKQTECWKFITPKSKKSMRKIVLTPLLKEALELHRLNSPGNKFDLVFANKKGEPMDGQNMLHREFYPTLVAAGLRKIRFHELRHTYCSLLIAQNENVKFIQTQLGHANVQTTIDRYGHIMPMDFKEVGTKLDNQIFNASANSGLTEEAQTAENLVYQR